MQGQAPLMVVRPAELPLRLVLEFPNESGIIAERVYVLRVSRRGRLLLNRDELAENQAA